MKRLIIFSSMEVDKLRRNLLSELSEDPDLPATDETIALLLTQMYRTDYMTLNPVRSYGILRDREDLFRDYLAVNIRLAKYIGVDTSVNNISVMEISGPTLKVAVA